MKNRSVERSMFYNAYPKIFNRAEALRNNMTESEKILWERLRKNQLGVRIKAQHPMEHFIADFYCHKAKLVIELDGEYHLTQQEYDKNRTAELEKYGVKVIRFTNEEVTGNIENVVEQIKNIIDELIG